MASSLSEIVAGFEENVRQVYGLVDFDRDIQDQALRILRQARASCDDLKYTTLLALDRGIELLDTVRTNDSLRRHYEQMHNQCVVLLVSYFDSAARSVFVNLLNVRLSTGKIRSRASVKMTLAELASLSREELIETFIARQRVSFQDMQSISKAFEEHVGFKPERDTDVNDIILGHTCRHVIVHAGGVFDSKAERQLRDAIPRTLKSEIRLGERVQFSADEIHALGAAMQRYVDRLMANEQAR
jgi:hypothetical protein